MKDFFNRKKLEILINDRNIDAIVLFSEIYFRYFIKFTGDNGFFFFDGDKSQLFTDGRYILQGEREVVGASVLLMSSYLTTIKDILSSGKYKRIGFDGKNVKYRFMMEIISNTNVEWVDISDDLDKIRMIKSNEEINNIKQSIFIQEKSLKKLLSFDLFGMTENEISVKLDFLMFENGADGNSFPTIVAINENAALPHYSPGNKILTEESLLLIDWGCKLNGYCSDQTVTKIFGKFSVDFQLIYDIVKQAQLKAIDYIKPGIRAKDIDRVAREFIKSEGFGDYFIHSLGHGVGLEIHEQPFISFNSETVIEKNMVFTIEPGIYLPDEFGVRLEDMILVKENKAELLTTIDK